MKFIKLNTFYFTIIVVTFITCGIPFVSAKKLNNPLHVFVSIMPQAYFVERIGGNRISVEVLVPPGKNPSNYTPPPSQIKKLKNATLFFRIGVPSENSLIPKIKTSADRLKIIDTREGIKLRKMDAGHHHSHSGNHHNQFIANGKDPHIWMSPLLVKRQAETIYHALVRIDPDGKNEYKANLKTFTSDMLALNKKIKDRLAPFKGKPILVFHPVFGYFADAYGLEQIAVETEGKPPKGKHLSFIIKKAKQKNIRVIFAQPQFGTNAVTTVAKAINGKVVFFNPLARDYINNLEVITDHVAKALQ